ncbi:MAG TPA: hypothetical protein VGH34_20975 [Vicinamibacterales bacterium]
MISDTPSRLFQPLTIESAPEGSKPVLERIKKDFGFIPNLMATFANSPAVLKGYLALDAEFEQTFGAVERQLILLTASLENVCAYCTAAHATVLKSMLHVPADVVSAIRSNSSTGNMKYDALVALTREIVHERGYVRETTIAAFLAAGYRKEQVMDVLIGVALKTISNYLDHLSPAVIDPPFIAEQ